MKFPCEDCITLSICLAKANDFKEDSDHFIQFTNHKCSLFKSYMPIGLEWSIFQKRFININPDYSHISDETWDERRVKILSLFYGEGSYKKINEISM